MIGKKVYIYGTGKYSKVLTEKLTDVNIHLEGYIDRVAQTKGFLDKDVLKVEDVLTSNQAFFIIIGSSFYQEISTRLMDVGLVEYRDFCSGDFFIPDLNIKTSYSQFGEDILLENILEKISHKGNGFFIDVGAYHPFKYSNTYKLYRKGWKGINIEPTPYKVELFNIFRNNDLNLNVGISQRESTKDFYIYIENAYNTLDIETVKQRSEAGIEFKEKKLLRFYPLKQIINKHAQNKEIDFLNIDVEGHELEVLKSYDWESVKPKIIAVEVFDLNNSDVKIFLEEKGYFLVSKSIATAFFVLKFLIQ